MKVGILMGSDSDLPIMKEAAEICKCSKTQNCLCREKWK